MSEIRQRGWRIDTDQIAKRAISSLAKAGVRMDFSPEVEERQRVWPEDCPFSEEELRAEIRGVVEDVSAIEKRLENLLGRIPGPPEYELEYEVPASFYGALHDRVAGLLEEGLRDWRKRLEAVLTTTPERIRAEWIATQLPEDVRGLLRKLVPEYLRGERG